MDNLSRLSNQSSVDGGLVLIFGDGWSLIDQGATNLDPSVSMRISRSLSKLRFVFRKIDNVVPMTVVEITKFAKRQIVFH